MESIASAFIKHHNIKVSSDADHHAINKMVGNHIDALIFNVASLAALVATLYDSKKLEKAHLAPVRAYITTKCDKPMKPSMKGGISMASDFYGYNHPAYSPEHKGSDMLTIDLGSGTLRPQIGGGSEVGVLENSKAALKRTREIFKHHEVRVKPDVFTEVVRIMDFHMRCLSHDLQQVQPLTEKRVAKVMKLKRHAVFQ